MTSTLPLDAPPSRVVQAALAAHASRDWAAVAALADPESAAEWSAQFIHANTHVPTLEEMRAECAEATPERLDGPRAAPAGRYPSLLRTRTRARFNPDDQ